jgi:hypothetical protein
LTHLSPARSVQIGYLDNNAHEMIELIQHYTFPADFFRWLTDGKFTFKILQERVQKGKYYRIVQYYVEDDLIYTGKVEYDLDKASKETVHFFTKKGIPIDASIPEFGNLSKQLITSVSVDLHYTSVSSILVKGEIVGFLWAIFELPQLIKLYNQMNDPMRHWRKS